MDALLLTKLKCRNKYLAKSPIKPELVYRSSRYDEFRPQQEKPENSLPVKFSHRMISCKEHEDKNKTGRQRSLADPHAESRHTMHSCSILKMREYNSLHGYVTSLHPILAFKYEYLGILGYDKKEEYLYFFDDSGKKS